MDLPCTGPCGLWNIFSSVTILVYDLPFAPVSDERALGVQLPLPFRNTTSLPGAACSFSGMVLGSWQDTPEP